MKYIKLFEQFDENDPFGEEINPNKYQEFKPGDILICIEPAVTLKLGGEYIFIKCYDHIQGTMVEIRDKNGEIIDGWRLNRFIKKK